VPFTPVAKEIKKTEFYHNENGEKTPESLAEEKCAPKHKKKKKKDTTIGLASQGGHLTKPLSAPDDQHNKKSLE